MRQPFNHSTHTVNPWRYSFEYAACPVVLLRLSVDLVSRPVALLRHPVVLLRHPVDLVSHPVALVRLPVNCLASS